MLIFYRFGFSIELSFAFALFKTQFLIVFMLLTRILDSSLEQSLIPYRIYVINQHIGQFT